MRLWTCWLSPICSRAQEVCEPESSIARVVSAVNWLATPREGFIDVRCNNERLLSRCVVPCQTARIVCNVPRPTHGHAAPCVTVYSSPKLRLCPHTLCQRSGITSKWQSPRARCSVQLGRRASGRNAGHSVPNSTTLQQQVKRLGHPTTPNTPFRRSLPESTSALTWSRTWRHGREEMR